LVDSAQTAFLCKGFITPWACPENWCSPALSTSVNLVQKHGPSSTELAALIQKWLAVSEEWEASQQIAI
jgi:hypothetical protein